MTGLWVLVVGTVLVALAFDQFVERLVLRGIVLDL